MASTVVAPAPVRIVRTIGGTLFRVALENLGDAEQWERIANLNGLVDPWIQGYVELSIPAPLPAQTTGGAIIAI